MTEKTPAKGRGSASRAEAVADYCGRFFGHFGAAPAASHVEDLRARTLRVAPVGDLQEFLGEKTLDIVFHASLEGDLVTPGSRLFDRMLDWLRELGRCSWVPLAARELPSRLPVGFGPLAPYQGVASLKRGTQHDLELVVQAVFVGEERHEDLVVVTLSEAGEAHTVESSVVAEVLAAGKVEPHSELAHPSQKKLKQQLDDALEWLTQWAKEQAAPREEEMLERLSTEVQRLTNYYGELIAQNEMNEDLREQLAHDLDLRVSEEVSSHRMAVEVNVVCFAVIARPVLDFDYEFEVLGKTIPMSWRVDCSDGLITSPVCPTCAEPAKTAAVCSGGEELHLACESCFGVCAVCQAHRCSDHGLVSCHIGGELLCSSCAPRCEGCGSPTRKSRLKQQDGTWLCTVCRE